VGGWQSESAVIFMFFGLQGINGTMSVLGIVSNYVKESQPQTTVISYYTYAQ
jgi:uncharacterized membrane protein